MEGSLHFMCCILELLILGGEAIVFCGVATMGRGFALQSPLFLEEFFALESSLFRFFDGMANRCAEFVDVVPEPSEFVCCAGFHGGPPFRLYLSVAPNS